jgi:hypothetical protein
MTAKKMSLVEAVALVQRADALFVRAAKAWERGHVRRKQAATCLVCERKGNNILDSVTSFPIFSPRKLTNFWDMIQFSVRQFHSAFAAVEKADRGVDFLEGEPFQEELSILIMVLVEFEKYADALKLTLTKDRCGQIKQYLERYLEKEPLPDNASDLMKALHSLPPSPISKDVVRSSLHGVVIMASNELKERKFAYIPASKAKFFEQDCLFGVSVASSLGEDAAKELKDAGNCLAADLNTSAVFHLMRVAELGLRALAREFGLHKIGEKELEYVTLEKLIEKIDSAIHVKLEKMQQTTASKNKDADLSFYRGLLRDAEFFKDETRNPLSHVRKSYNEAGALNVYSHVEEFMQRLVTKLSDNNKI